MTDSTGHTSPRLSLLLPGWNEDQNIAKCIASLKRQIYPNFNVYMILGGEDPTATDRAKHAKWEQLVILDQIEPNKMKAYNVALAQPGLGEILIFSDMDCEFPDNFFDHYKDAFADQKKNIITGRVCPDPEANSFVDRYHRHFEEKIAPVSVKKMKSIVGSNFAVRKNFFFNTYSRFDESIAIGTDHAIATRFNDIGEIIYFNPSIKVYTPFSSKGLLEYIKQQSRWVRIRVLGNKGSNPRAFKKSIKALLLPWFMAIFIPLSLIVSKQFISGPIYPVWYAVLFAWGVLLTGALSKRYAIFRRGQGNRWKDLMGACGMLVIHYGIQMIAGLQIVSKKYKYRW